MKRGKILYLTVRRHPQELRELIRTELREASLEFVEVEYEDLDGFDMATLEDFSAVLLAPARKVPPEVIRGLVNCQLIQIWSSGYEKFDTNFAKELGHKIANNGGANSRSVAEHTMNLLLGVSRRNIEMHHRVISGEWAGNDHGMTSHSLNDKTLGLIGYGKVARIVEELALVFKMKVIFTDIQERLKLNPNYRPLDTLVKEADYISLHMHLTKQTTGMINNQLFNLMAPRQPFIINVSRAELIDEASLIKALSERSIRGLAMDVHYKEPNLSDSPLYAFRNTLFSPHVAGSTIETYLIAINFCVQNIRRALDGLKIESLI
jgi:phosphoglycerate dehydrogenase-like enzyme